MRLRYFISDNFGDALNPYIFNRLLPDFFDEDPSIDFLGIGSILGFEMINEADRKIIFSSGYAYGGVPVINETHDIVCVRGPLTAKALNLDPKLAIADGAILLSTFDIPSRPKRHTFSFMPHWESALKYDWQPMCEELGIQYIAPTETTENVIDSILSSEVVIAEAMHAAIVSDCLRVPWIPVKLYNGINEFKWQDWAGSLDISYKPIFLKSLFQDTPFNRSLSKKKIASFVPEAIYGIGLKGYEVIQSAFIEQKVKDQFKAVMQAAPSLSKESILRSRVSQLLEKIDYIKRKYN